MKFSLQLNNIATRWRVKNTPKFTFTDGVTNINTEIVQEGNEGRFRPFCASQHIKATQRIQRFPVVKTRRRDAYANPVRNDFYLRSES